MTSRLSSDDDQVRAAVADLGALDGGRPEFDRLPGGAGPLLAVVGDGGYAGRARHQLDSVTTVLAESVEEPFPRSETSQTELVQL